MSTPPLTRNMCPTYLGSQHNHNNNAKACLGWLQKSVIQTKFIVTFVIMLTPNKRSSQKLCKHYLATSVQQRELSCQITLGPRPCISRCLYFSPSCCHAPPPTMFFSSTTLAQSHISINFFLLSRSCLKGTVSRQSLKMASTWTLFFYILQMVMITCIITKHFFVKSLVKILKPNEM